MNTLQTFDAVNADWKLVCPRVRGQYYLSIETLTDRPNSRKEVSVWKCNCKIVYPLWHILLRFLDHFILASGLLALIRWYTKSLSCRKWTLFCSQYISANLQSNTRSPYACSVLLLCNKLCTLQLNLNLEVLTLIKKKVFDLVFYQWCSYMWIENIHIFLYPDHLLLFFYKYRSILPKCRLLIVLLKMHVIRSVMTNRKR